jgi:Polysaccharide pyruvyl transferase.
MKIATLAYQRHENVGAVLQCYALQKTIITQGHDCEVIDYICDAADRIFGFRSFQVKGIKKYITSCIGVISRFPKKYAFMRFRKDILVTTSKYDKKNIAELDNKYDGYIVGSDNVWNSQLTGLDPNYFFQFVSNDLKKASYAASLGLGKVPENERSDFKHYLSKFSVITTREKAASEDISSLLERKVYDTCDPTLFLTREEWNELLIEPKERNYVLVYHMSPSASFVRFAKEVAKEKGLPIVYIPFPYGFCRCAMKPHIGPQEWLGYIKNADYVITDSFHGCVFSSIYERNLIIKISQLGERIKNLTEKLGIQNRIVDSVKQALQLPSMDYLNIRKNIIQYRSDGLDNLNIILNHFEEIRDKG